MKRFIALLSVVSLLMVSGLRSVVAAGSGLPASDQRGKVVRDLNTPRSFTDPKSKADWEARAVEIRQQALVSCGLWPLPERPPLNAKIFGRIEREGYSIEKVYFQSYPGFYVAGNLYRPLGKGKGPFPGVLNPHGHWKNGRMADEESGSIAGRCINFAKQGMVAFSWDMVGYNDTMQLGEHRKFFNQPALELWGINLMGLQTWNSIRALDFLESLPDVDRKRLACTGESGGGTQTFMLGAVDNRLAVQAPIVMVSHTMQGGCQCENAPALRVDYFNVEIAGVPAPRPQMLVACTGDWTKATMKMEGPALDRIYSLMGKPYQVRYDIFNYNHNYNQTSREAVYPWFGLWLNYDTNAANYKEQAFKKEPDAALRVFPDGKAPADALDETAFIAARKDEARKQFNALAPRDARSLAAFQAAVQPAWRHTLLVELPERDVIVEYGGQQRGEGYTATTLAMGRAGRNDRLAALYLEPAKDAVRTMVVLVHPEGKGACLDAAGAPKGLAKALLARGQTVLLLDTFQTGSLADAAAAKARKPLEKLFTSYNRTDVQERVQDLITACSFGSSHGKLGRRTVVLCGQGRAGLWALLAAPAADAVVADCAQLDSSDDATLLAPDLFVPGLQKLGGFESATLLAAPHPVVLHNTGERFATTHLRSAYDGLKAAKSLQVERAALSDEAIAGAIAGMKK